MNTAIVDNPVVKLTAAALAKVKAELAKKPETIGLRVGVKKSGCSGYMYVLDYVRALRDDDLVFDVGQGVKVVIDGASIPVLEGTEIDYVSEGLNRIFRFNNPRAHSQCGCGESFSV